MIEEASGTRLYESKKESAQKTIEKKDAKLKEIDSVILSIIINMLLLIRPVICGGMNKMLGCCRVGIQALNKPYIAKYQTFCTTTSVNLTQLALIASLFCEIMCNDGHWAVYCHSR